MKDFLHLPHPTKGARPSGKDILIYGASSSVGAVASGLKFVATASPKHHGLARSLGATEVFDNKDPDTVDKLECVLKSAGAIALPPTRKICVAVLEKFGGGFIASTVAPEDGEGRGSLTRSRPLCVGRKLLQNILEKG
jgi:hypothetical protein